MLKDLTDAKGIPGNEKEVREMFESYIRPYADELTTDNLGSSIAKKTGDENGPNIMIAGHLDEIGLMVTRIDENGFLFPDSWRLVESGYAGAACSDYGLKGRCDWCYRL